MNGVIQRELSFLLLLWGLSDQRMAELCEMPRCFSIKLHSETQVSGHLGMSGGRSPRHAQNPLPGERRKTLSITHHTLSPHPHIIICTSLISSIDYNVFIVLQCHLKDHLCTSQQFLHLPVLHSANTRRCLSCGSTSRR